MNAIRSALLFTFLCCVQLTGMALAQDYPAYREVFINDFENLLTPQSEEALRDKLQAVKAQAGVEMTVVTIGSRSDYGASGAIEPFATGLFNEWGVGDATRNDGVMILVAKDDREMRIELGSGYGRRRDSDMKRIIDTFMVPHFRSGDYQTGIEAGVDAVIFELAGPIAGVENSPTKFYEPESKNTGVLALFAASILGIPGLGAGVYYFRRHLRNKPRHCVNCNAPATRLREDEEDEYLEDAKQLEEMIKSVDYDVWKCHACGHMTINRYAAWFSGFGACPECRYKTLESDRTTITPATTSSSGRERIDYECVNCSYENTEYRTIPRKSEHTSGSSSSSSFGGGSSSGGGASGSW